MANHLKFGMFMAPFHPTGQNPTLLLEHDLQLIEHLDRLGFDEVWVGEHHSGGWEIISSPEVFIATAAGRTKNIRFGTGVNTLPYHHPFILADRWLLLDHLTKGRVIFGVGAGSLSADAYQMGIDPLELRPRMEEALEAMVALFDGSEPVTRKTDWFELRDARLHMRPYSDPIDIRVAMLASPSGPRAAGRFGAGLLAIGATTSGGFNFLADTWNIVTTVGEDYGQKVDRSRWSLVAPMHIAETREQARKEASYGVTKFVDYFTKASPFKMEASLDDAEAVMDELVGSGFAVIGTPDDAIEQIERLLEQSGGFGSFLTFAHDWAPRAATYHSYELLAQYVVPHFNGQLNKQDESYDWMIGNKDQFTGAFVAAQDKARAQHEAEVAAKNPSGR